MKSYCKPQAQQGFALMLALVILLLVGSLSVVMSRMAVSSSQSASLSLQHERALAAARSGIAWARYQVLNSGACVNDAFDLAGISLDSFDVAITCSVTTHRVGNQDVQQFLLVVVSSAGDYGDPGFVSRRVEALISDG